LSSIEASGCHTTQREGATTISVMTLGIMTFSIKALRNSKMTLNSVL
jgi:hypothetical protein